MRRPARVAVVLSATVVPAVVAWVLVGAANPPHHDLSDIGTGLLQLALAVLAAVTGLALAVALTRRGRP